MLKPPRGRIRRQLSRWRRKRRGLLDGCAHNRVRGWAVDENGQPPLLDIYVDGKWRSEFVPSRNRDDLVAEGLYKAAFEVSLDPELPVDKPSTIRVCFKDGRDLINSPMQFEPAGFTFVNAHTNFNKTRYALAKQYLAGEGIEIGALHRPLEVPSSLRVRFVDCFTAEELQTHYTELGAHSIVKPDIIDDGGTLKTLGDESVDFVIANHFIEHTEDPIKVLETFARVIKKGGALYLGVPDKRYNFDKDRALTTIEHLIHDHEEGPEAARMDHYRDYAEKVDLADPHMIEKHARWRAETKYSIHFHLWTTETFLEFLTFVLRKYELPFDLEVAVKNQIQDEKELVAILSRH